MSSLQPLCGLSARSSLALAALGSLVLATLSGCGTLGPDYRRPAIPLPPGYSAAMPADAAPGVPDAWWSLFGDPALDRLEAEALAANQDLAAAAGRVEEARALLGLTRADRFPEVSAGLSGSRSRLSQQTSQLPPGFPLEFTRISASLDATYEFDFWGRFARATEAARAELLATEEGQRNVRLGVSASVATAYLDLLSLDRQLAIARETRTSREEAVRLQKLRYDGGTISELDLAQAQAALAATEAAVPALERALRQTEDALGVLLGRFGGAVERGSGSGTESGGETGLVSLTLPAVPGGLPSELLLRRPDVVAAEQGLVAANARIGQARAAYFPSFSLTGSLGQESTVLSELASSGAGVFSAALRLVQPIWNAGRTKRQVEGATARQHQALAAYLKAAQSAYADVEDALAARSTGTTEREALARQVEALARALHLSQLRYDAGESSYLEVLDAERGLFRAQLDATRARRDELAAAVSLFKALGGGWTGTGSSAEATPTAPPPVP